LASNYEPKHALLMSTLNMRENNILNITILAKTTKIPIKSLYMKQVDERINTVYFSYQ